MYDAYLVQHSSVASPVSALFCGGRTHSLQVPPFTFGGINPTRHSFVNLEKSGLGLRGSVGPFLTTIFDRLPPLALTSPIFDASMIGWNALQIDLLPLKEETRFLHAWRLRFLDARFQAGFLDASWLIPWPLQVARWLAARLAIWLAGSLSCWACRACWREGLA